VSICSYNVEHKDAKEWQMLFGQQCGCSCNASATALVHDLYQSPHLNAMVDVPCVHTTALTGSMSNTQVLQHIISKNLGIASVASALATNLIWGPLFRSEVATVTACKPKRLQGKGFGALSVCNASQSQNLGGRTALPQSPSKSINERDKIMWAIVRNWPMAGWVSKGKASQRPFFTLQQRWAPAAVQPSYAGSEVDGSCSPRSPARQHHSNGSQAGAKVKSQQQEPTPPRVLSTVFVCAGAHKATAQKHCSASCWITFSPKCQS